MGNQSCELVSQSSKQNQAYGQFEVIWSGRSEAKIVKVIEKSSSVKKSIQSSLDKRSLFQNNNLCELYSFSISEEQQIYLMTLRYEYLSLSLAEKVQSSNQTLPTEQLMKLMTQVSSALKVLYDANIKHGCINLNTILCSENGYKITDVSSTSYLTLMELVQRGSTKQPISRKIIKFVNDSTIKLIILRELTLEDDLFSLGMLVLSLGTGTEVREYYNYEKVQGRLGITLKEETISDYLFLLKKRHNKFLQRMVRRLLFPSKIYTEEQISMILSEKGEKEQRTRVETDKYSNQSIRFQQSN